MSLLKDDEIPEEVRENIVKVLKQFAGKDDGVCSVKQPIKKKATKKVKEDEPKSSKEELIDKLRASGKVKIKSPACVQTSNPPKNITEIEKPKGHLVSGVVKKLYKGTKEEAINEFEKEFGFKANSINGEYFNNCNGCGCILTYRSNFTNYDNKIYCIKCKKKIDEAVKKITQGEV